MSNARSYLKLILEKVSLGLVATSNKVYMGNDNDSNRTTSYAILLLSISLFIYTFRREFHHGIQYNDIQQYNGIQQFNSDSSLVVKRQSDRIKEQNHLIEKLAGVGL